MSFIWPPMLVLLGLVPVLVVGYLELVRRRDVRRSGLADIALTPSTPAGVRSARKHLPFALFIVAITLMLVGFARPEMVIGIPRIEGTVIIAFDTSRSMAADDVEPTRLDLAKEAAIEFVDRRPSNVDVGLVSFTNGAVITQTPTDVDEDVIAGIERLQPLGPTSLGQGLFTALGAIVGSPIAVDTANDADLASTDIGYHSSAVVLFFSDGENTSDPDPLEVAKLAANAGVTVFTVGMGTTGGTIVEIDGYLVGTALDAEILDEMADVTGGAYFDSLGPDDFEAVYDTIDLEFGVDGEKTEITALIAGAAIILLLTSAGLSLRWFGRIA